MSDLSAEFAALLRRAAAEGQSLEDVATTLEGESERSVWTAGVAPAAPARPGVSATRVQQAGEGRTRPTGWKIGYARVSTDEQDPALQVEALQRVACDEIHSEHASGVSADRPVLADVLARLRPGDTLVVWKLDRLGRSLKDLIHIVTTLRAREIDFQSVTEGMDTSTAGGELLFHFFGAIAQFERRLIQERTMAGLAAARARGGGRKVTALTPDRKRAIIALRAQGDNVTQIAAATGVSRASVYRALDQARLSGRPIEGGPAA